MAGVSEQEVRQGAGDGFAVKAVAQGRRGPKPPHTGLPNVGPKETGESPPTLHSARGGADSPAHTGLPSVG